MRAAKWAHRNKIRVRVAPGPPQWTASTVTARCDLFWSSWRQQSQIGSQHIQELQTDKAMQISFYYKSTLVLPSVALNKCWTVKSMTYFEGILWPVIFALVNPNVRRLDDGRQWISSGFFASIQKKQVHNKVHQAEQRCVHFTFTSLATVQWVLKFVSGCLSTSTPLRSASMRHGVPPTIVDILSVCLRARQLSLNLG